jgi:hypothetical protein
VWEEMKILKSGFLAFMVAFALQNVNAEDIYEQIDSG